MKELRRQRPFDPYIDLIDSRVEAERINSDILRETRSDDYIDDISGVHDGFIHQKEN